MARGVEAVAPLPKVSFVKVDDDTLSKPAGVGDNTARGFGCESICVLLPAGLRRSHALVPQITMAPNSRDQTITFGTAVGAYLLGRLESYELVSRATGEGTRCTGRV